MTVLAWLVSLVVYQGGRAPGLQLRPATIGRAFAPAVLKCPAMVEQIGFGIIGAGNIAALHAQAIAALGPQANVRAAGGAGHEPGARARRWPAQFGAEALPTPPRFFARPDIQVVTICTPSGTHADLGLQAAAAGKHVIVEKPIDVTMAARGR